MRWNYLSVPKLQRCICWSLGTDNWFHPTLYRGMWLLIYAGIELVHKCKRGPRCVSFSAPETNTCPMTISLYLNSDWKPILLRWDLRYGENCTYITLLISDVLRSPITKDIVCLFHCSIISYLFIFSPTPTLPIILRHLSSCMCSITPETAKVSSNYNHMRTPGIDCWFSDPSQCNILTIKITKTQIRFSFHSNLLTLAPWRF